MWQVAHRSAAPPGLGIFLCTRPALEVLGFHISRLRRNSGESNLKEASLEPPKQTRFFPM